MNYKFNNVEHEKMVRYLEKNISPEKRVELIHKIYKDKESTMENSLKIYNVKCWVYSRPYVKVVAATSEKNVRELLEKEPVEIEDIVELDIETAQELHSYELN